jgi:hypothetical protein
MARLFFQYFRADLRQAGIDRKIAVVACDTGQPSYIDIIMLYVANSMNQNLITVETRRGAAQVVLHRVMRMVPDKDKSDKRLQRLLAFRLQHDGEAATCEYLMRHIRRYIRRPQPRRFYDFLVQDQARDPNPARTQGLDPDPPGAA